MSSLIKSCSLDPIPTFIFLPLFTHTVNASLLWGRLPDSQKHAIVMPLLKKPGQDTTDMNNYRLVSNLSFMLKLIERVVANQLNEYLSANNLLLRFQSAYRKGHSTETTLLRVWSDMLMAADERTVTLLLDMSSVFDHLILLQRLQVVVANGDTALDWIWSFFSGRTQQVVYGGEQSVTSAVLFGVPQGTVLGPLLTSSRNIESTVINMPTTCNCISGAAGGSYDHY